jgi:hypothetical protein
VWFLLSVLDAGVPVRIRCPSLFGVLQEELGHHVGGRHLFQRNPVILNQCLTLWISDGLGLFRKGSQGYLQNLFSWGRTVGRLRAGD